MASPLPALDEARGPVAKKPRRVPLPCRHARTETGP